ncbi:MAG: hypothetical protein WCG80_05940 [Spirochaetales bacterium]
MMRWDGPIYRLTDGQGNAYVMHATETGTPNLNVTLPAGWSLEKVELAGRVLQHPRRLPRAGVPPVRVRRRVLPGEVNVAAYGLLSHREFDREERSS